MEACQEFGTILARLVVTSRREAFLILTSIFLLFRPFLMPTTLITLKLEQELKDQATQVAQSLGIPLATFLKMSLKKLVQEQRIDFQLLDVPSVQTREKWLKQLQETREGKKISSEINSIEALAKNLEN